MAKALQALSEEDPTFQVRTDEETAQTVISGMGELHLEVLVDRMKREFSVEANIGRPQVAYRETVKGEAKKCLKYTVGDVTVWGHDDVPGFAVRVKTGTETAEVIEWAGDPAARLETKKPAANNGNNSRRLINVPPLRYRDTAQASRSSGRCGLS